MSLSILLSQLTIEERQAAHDLWDALVFPESHRTAEIARQQLVDAPIHVQHALTNAIAAILRQGHELHTQPNPFVM